MQHISPRPHLRIVVLDLFEALSNPTHTSLIVLSAVANRFIYDCYYSTQLFIILRPRSYCAETEIEVNIHLRDCINCDRQPLSRTNYSTSDPRYSRRSGITVTGPSQRTPCGFVNGIT